MRLIKKEKLSKSIHCIFKNQVKKTPEKIALVWKDNRINYKELNQNANLLGDLLKARIDRGTANYIVIFLDRSPNAIISMLGILKAGGAYIPIDISYPADRISFILKDCNPRVILTTKALTKRLPKTDIPTILLDDISYTPGKLKKKSLSDVSVGDPAYVIYTSGSTGTPKGVIVPHRGVVRLVYGQSYIDFGHEKTFLQMASLSFDAATFEIWGALLHGATCVLYPDDYIPNATILQKLIRENKITTIWLTTSLFNTLITAQPDCLKGVCDLLVGGEALSPPHIRKAFEKLPKTKIINGYGPTENTTFTTCYPIQQDFPEECSSIPIGKPIAYTTTYILDRELQPVSKGDIGELFTGGEGLALGYLNQPELTAERFITNPFENGQVLYRTGDLVRQLANGNLDYIGRIDDQVKIRGFRIELGEITSVLLGHPNVKEVVATVIANDRAIKHIVAYLIFHDGCTSDEEIKSYLVEILPDYMIPSFFVPIDAIPLTNNGKLDKKQLPEPLFAGQGDFILPGSNTEKQLAEIWEQLLGIDQISIVDNFFDIGGTSILGVELFVLIDKKFDLKEEIEAVVLYEFPTIQSLALHLDSQDVVAEKSMVTKKRAAFQKSAFNKFQKSKNS